jgi:hypothetical protein
MSTSPYSLSLQPQKSCLSSSPLRVMATKGWWKGSGLPPAATMSLRRHDGGYRHESGGGAGITLGQARLSETSPLRALLPPCKLSYDFFRSIASYSVPRPIALSFIYVGPRAWRDTRRYRERQGEIRLVWFESITNTHYMKP